MRSLYDSMEEWQHINNKRLLSISIQKDESSYCCIALTNPTEVVITSEDGRVHASVIEKRMDFPGSTPLIEAALFTSKSTSNKL